MGLAKDVMHLRPENTVKIISQSSKLCPVSSNHIFKTLKGRNVAVMACNTRIKHVIPGIMRAAKDLDAIVGFELAKTECDMSGGYTGMTPKDFTTAIFQYAEEFAFHLPFFIHADHMVVKTPKSEDIEGTRAVMMVQLDAGYTSFAIDASYNEVHDNIMITTSLGKAINERGLGLETEVGEIKSIKSGGALTTLEEAKEYIEGIYANGIRPNLLAINNGSKHGHYGAGEAVNIDLVTTKKIADFLKDKIDGIAQHGITGTPPEVMAKFADYGILKGNVGTHWQDIAHEGLPPDLFDMIKKWSLDNKKDIKNATKVFKREIDNIPQKNQKLIEDKAYEQAISFMKLFRSNGTASMLVQAMGK